MHSLLSLLLTMRIIILYNLNMRNHITKAESNQTKKINMYTLDGVAKTTTHEKRTISTLFIKFVKSHYKETTINKCINQPLARKWLGFYCFIFGLYKLGIFLC